LWYKDFRSEVWLRVAGYVETDINLLFDYLRNQKVNKKRLKAIIRDWNDSDDLFKDLNFNCLLKGYLRSKTSAECFLSVYYILLNDASIGYDPLSENELKSVFSRIPLYGRFK
jgi:hypothetical protein